MKEKANIITIRVKVKCGSIPLFIDWQSKLNALITTFPGFLSLEIISERLAKQDFWVIIERFLDEDSALSWQNSDQKKELFKDLESLIDQEMGFRETLSLESNLKKGVTEVFVTSVSKELEGVYRNWIAKIHQAEAKFSGFQGVYVQSPSNEESETWITFLQFDTPYNLDLWLKSKERQEILNESKPFIKKLERHRVVSPYASWFETLSLENDFPPVWKQTMIVLLVLFPIVMLEQKFLMPLLHEFNNSFATFISNVISVTLLAWPFMPIAIYFLTWWLSPKENKALMTWLGFFLLLFLYLLEVLFFWALG